MSSQSVTYDDRDSAFQYTGGWFLDGTWSASNGQSGTLSGTNDLNGYLTFTFPTPAVSFTYYGIKRSHGGLYGVCVDCNINSPSFTTIDGFDASDNGQNPPIALYSQSFSQPAIHTVILKNEADSRGTPVGNSQLVVDRFVLEVLIPSTSTTSTTPAQVSTPKPPPTTTSTTSTTTSSSSSSQGTTSTTVSSSVSSSSSGTTSSTSTTSSGSASPSSSSTTEPGTLIGGLSTQSPPSSSGVPIAANESGSPHSGGSSSNLGPIIGAVVGSLAVIGLILLIIFCLRRRRRSKAETINKSQVNTNSVPRSPLPMSTVDPFVVSSATESFSHPTSGSDGSITMPLANSLSTKVSANSMEKRRSLHQRRLPSIPQASSSTTQSSSPPSSTTQGGERDGGHLSFYTVDEDLPPKYSQIFSP